MIDLRIIEKDLLRAHLFDGCIAADFTMGNGHDTLFLSQNVGSGHVYSFDIQQKALDSTTALLEESGAADNYSLILDSHHNASRYFDSFDVGVFNLGYLPGGDKHLTTKRETTVSAVESAAKMLNSGGILLVIVYPGHPEGRVEGNLLDRLLSGYDRKVINVTRLEIANSPDSPFFFALEKK